MSISVQETKKPKCFIPPRDSAPQSPKGSNCFYLCFIVAVGNDTGGFNLQEVFYLFETLKMFYPPERLCRAEPERGPIVFTYVFLCRKGFQFTDGFLTLKMFYPPEGLCRVEPERGRIVF